MLLALVLQPSHAHVRMPLVQPRIDNVVSPRFQGNDCEDGFWTEVVPLLVHAT